MRQELKQLRIRTSKEGENSLDLVVACQTTDTALNQDKTEFGIPVLAVPLQMLADGDGLLDQVVDIFRQVGGKSLRLEDPENLVSGDEANLCDTMGIPEDNTDLGRSQTFLCQFEDLFVDLFTGQFQPVGNSPAVWQSRLGNTLSGSVHTTHLGIF